jgi:hypothetical protein
VDHFLRELSVRQFCQLKHRSATVVAEVSFKPPPPEAVAPKRFPASSKMTNPLELHPSLLPRNLCRIVSFQVPLLVGESS